MKLTKKQEREHIIRMLTSILESNILIMEFYKDISIDKKSRDICKKSIEQSKQGIKTLNEIRHMEILRSMFNKIIVGKETYFATVGSLCAYDRIKIWDTTETGFKEFVRLEEEERKLHEKELQEQQENKELIERAQREGKKVEMLYDQESKKIKPVIFEEKPNA